MMFVWVAALLEASDFFALCVCVCVLMGVPCSAKVMTMAVSAMPAGPCWKKLQTKLHLQALTVSNVTEACRH